MTVLKRSGKRIVTEFTRPASSRLVLNLTGHNCRSRKTSSWKPMCPQAKEAFEQLKRSRRQTGECGATWSLSYYSMPLRFLSLVSVAWITTDLSPRPSLLLHFWCTALRNLADAKVMRENQVTCMQSSSFEIWVVGWQNLPSRHFSTEDANGAHAREFASQALMVLWSRREPHSVIVCCLVLLVAQCENNSFANVYSKTAEH
jgi:hypothetical protein